MGTSYSFNEILNRRKLEKFNPYHDSRGRFARAPGSGGGGLSGPMLAPDKGGGAGSATATGATGGTTAEEDKAYMAAVKAGDMETAQRMVNEKALRVGAELFTETETPAYKIRTGPEPKETVTVYKTFFVDDEGNPSALFVEGTSRLPVGVWLDAQDAYHFQNAQNGKYYTPSKKNPNSDGSGKTGASIPIPNETVRQELIDRGFLPEGSTASSVTALAYRPGWHAGDLPFFPQGGKQGNPRYNENGTPNKRFDPSKPETNYQNIHRKNQVVFECEMAADINYTNQTQIKSGANKGKVKYTDMQEMPENGFYKFATNPMTNANELGSWYISGSLKIKRALTEDECNEILNKNGFKSQEWEGGKLDLSAFNYDPKKTDAGKKLPDAVTYDDDGNIIPLSQRFTSATDVRKFNDRHDPATGRFAPKNGGGAGGGTSSVAIAVKKVEDANRFADKEIGTVIGADGNVIMTVGGDKECVTIKAKDAEKLKGAIFTHNHVTGSARPSIEDIQNTVDAELGELRATDRNGNTSSLKLVSKSAEAHRFATAYEYKAIEGGRNAGNEAHKEWMRNLTAEQRKGFWGNKELMAEGDEAYGDAAEKYINDWLTANAPQYGYSYSFEGEAQ